MNLIRAILSKSAEAGLVVACGLLASCASRPVSPPVPLMLPATAPSASFAAVPPPPPVQNVCITSPGSLAPVVVYASGSLKEPLGAWTPIGTVPVGQALTNRVAGAEAAFFYGKVTNATVTLGWDASTGPVSGYVVWTGHARETATNAFVATNTEASVAGLVSGQTYFFTVTAFDQIGVQSIPADWLTYTPPFPLLKIVTEPAQ